MEEVTLTDVKDTKRVSKRGLKICDGVCEYKIHNDEVWNLIKNGEYKGVLFFGWLPLEETI